MTAQSKLSSYKDPDDVIQLVGECCTNVFQRQVILYILKEFLNYSDGFQF